MTRPIRILLCACAVLAAPVLAGAQTSDPRPDAFRAASLKRAVILEPSAIPHESGSDRQAVVQKRNWIQRQPVLFGTLVGFGAGFLIGAVPGEAGVFYDLGPGVSGLTIGGIGAGVGALVGKLAGR